MRDDIPMPAPQTKWGYLDDMNVGDSEFDPEGTETSSTGSKLYATMVRKANKFGWKVQGRKVDGGVRVWRIS